MQILSTVLAFAILMVAFSTVASGVTELLLRLASFRALVLRRSINRFLNHAVWRSFVEASRAQGAEVDESSKTETLSTLLDDLTRNDVANERQLTLFGKTFQLPGCWIEELSSQAFVQRLAKSDVGRVFSAEVAGGRESRITDFSLTFERYMAESAEIFRKRANLFAIVVSVALAFGGNIHLGKLINHLSDNPEIVAKILESETAILAEPKRAIFLGENGEVESEEVKKLKAQYTNLQKKFQLPIGWDYRRKPAFEWAYFVWFTNVLLAGALIGLGAPFWYRIVKTLGRTASFGRALGLQNPETVGRTEVSHDQNAMARTQTNVALFAASAQIDSTVPPVHVDDQPPPVG